jgi:hypothetical protein
MIDLMILLFAQAAPAGPAPKDEIVVVGRRVEQDLAECLAHDCPPAKDMEMSLQASVEQFAGGRYADARRTLQNAIRRNRDHAADLPGPVSSLHATLATVAEHMGETVLWRWSALDSVRVLRRYLGETNIATLGQELSFGDDMVGLGMPSEAAKMYRTVQRKATESGHSALAAGAAFRRAWLALGLGRDREAERLADEAVALAGTHARSMTELRDVLRTRIAIRHGDEGAVDALAMRLRHSATHAPAVIYAPPVEDINRVSSGIETSPWNNGDIGFADVGYWIRPDGRTSGVEVLRNSGLGQWTPGIFRHVKARRYVPFAAEPGAAGNYRIDRFTVRANLGLSTGTRIMQRMGRLTVHVVDLTETDTMAGAYRQRMQDAPASPTD